MIRKNMMRPHRNTKRQKIRPRILILPISTWELLSLKNGAFKESIDAFTQSLNTERPKLEADATYNIANARYKLGSELLSSDLNGAADLYRESLDYYKRTIELNETNSAAKHNHELVEKELKVLLEKIKNQPPQQQQDEQDKDKDQKEENQEDQQSQEDSEGDKEKQEQEQQQDKQQDEDKQKQEEQEDSESAAGDQGEDQKEASGQGDEDSREMTPEEAKMLLDAFADEEAMDSLKKKKQRYNSDVLKDW